MISVRSEIFVKFHMRLHIPLVKILKMCFDRRMSIMHSDEHLSPAEGNENILCLEEELARLVAEGEISQAAAEDFCKFALLDPASIERQTWRHNPEGTASLIYDMGSVGQSGDPHPVPVKFRKGKEQIGALLDAELVRRFPPPSKDPTPLPDAHVSGVLPNIHGLVVPSSVDLSWQIETAIEEGRSTRRAWMRKVFKTAGAVSAITALAYLHPKTRHMLGIAPNLATVIHNFPRSFPSATVTMTGDLEHPKSVSILISMPQPLPHSLDLREQASGSLFSASEENAPLSSSHAIARSKSALSSQENPTVAIAYCMEHCSPITLFCSRDFDAWSLEEMRQWMKSADEALLTAKTRRDAMDPKHLLYRDAERDYQMKVAVTEAYRKELERIFGPHACQLLTQQNLSVSHLHPDFYNTDGMNSEAFEIAKIPDADPTNLSENLDAQSFGHNVKEVMRHRIASGKTGTSIILCAPEHLQTCSKALHAEIGMKKGFAAIIIDIEAKMPQERIR